MDIPVRKILEAATTEAISQISYDERVAIADVYEKITNKVGKPLCNACLIKMCKGCIYPCLMGQIHHILRKVLTPHLIKVVIE